MDMRRFSILATFLAMIAIGLGFIAGMACVYYYSVGLSFGWSLLAAIGSDLALLGIFVICVLIAGKRKD